MVASATQRSCLRRSCCLKLLDLQMCLAWGLGRGWAFVEDDTLDRSEPREAVDISAPEPRALPPPEPPEHPDRVRGRHEAPKRTFGGPGRPSPSCSPRWCSPGCWPPG